MKTLKNNYQPWEMKLILLEEDVVTASSHEGKNNNDNFFEEGDIWS